MNPVLRIRSTAASNSDSDAEHDDDVDGNEEHMSLTIDARTLEGLQTFHFASLLRPTWNTNAETTAAVLAYPCVALPRYSVLHARENFQALQ